MGPYKVFPTITILRLLIIALVAGGSTSHAELLTAEEMAKKVVPPYMLGEPVNDQGVWTIMNLDGAEAGYIFETVPLAPIPGFSGRPINMVVSMTHDGQLLKVEILHHGEPVFVSGLGDAPFHEFVAQYRGHSILDSLSVGVPYGKVEGASSQIYLDGVTKATASVRIAHESVLAAAYAVARDKMRGLAAGPRPKPDMSYQENLTFQDLVDQGIAVNHIFTNGEVQQLFIGSEWESDDEIALELPDTPYLDLWIIDIAPPSVARAVLDEESLDKLAYFLSISPDDEPILLIDRGRHGLVSEDFVRNTEPDLLSAKQDGLPVALRDADLELSLLPGLPQGNQLVIRSDRRLGFDPIRPWELSLKVVRKHGSFMPTIGTVDLTVTHQSPPRFYVTPQTDQPLSPFEAAIYGRLIDHIVIILFLAILIAVLGWGLKRLARHQHFQIIRMSILVLVIGFVGWWGQGQLSIVTVLGVMDAAFSGQALDFLLYDPFSLFIWVTVIGSFVYWGRGFFCGWLCPYGAMQEVTGFIGEKLGLKQIRVSKFWDQQLKKIKYIILALLVWMTFFAPDAAETMVEVEPFKTAITTYFIREWYFVAYAALWLILGLFLFKGFCRYVCPLGAFMAIGGLLRRKNWIERRAECGSPCQLCAVKCKYNAIKPGGEISYDECFQCLDCVTIYEDKNTCVPLVLQQKGKPIKVSI